MKKNKKIPEAVCIGHFCHDVHEDGYILGGAASYCSLMLQQLGKETAVMTSVGKDFLFHPRFKSVGIRVYNKVAPQTTIFHNVYDKNGDRTQYLKARALTIAEVDIPNDWEKTPLLLLGLIADEATPSLVDAFPKALMGAIIQGWLRQWDEQGTVSSKTMNWELLKSIDVILFSENDLIGLEDKITTITKYAKVAVMTKGKNGAIVFHNGQAHHFPAFPVPEIDPTGAGDVFAATFLYYFERYKDIVIATGHAHAAASFVVEKIGVQLPTKKAIERRFLEYQRLFLA